MRRSHAGSLLIAAALVLSGLGPAAARADAGSAACSHRKASGTPPLLALWM